MVAEVLSIGTELLLGQIVDTNAAYLARILSALGIDLYHKTTVGDNAGRVVGAGDQHRLQQLAPRRPIARFEAGLRLVAGDLHRRDGRGVVEGTGVEDQPGVAAAIFGPLADAGVNVDMIVQNVSEDGTRTDMTFTVPAGDLAKAMQVIENAKAEMRFDVVQSERDLTKVSVIGIGMRSHTGVAATAFKALAARGINIRAITTSEIKISILIDREYTELAVRSLHSVYGLDKA